jgi:hypothetical protein
MQLPPPVGAPTEPSTPSKILLLLTAATELISNIRNMAKTVLKPSKPTSNAIKAKTKNKQAKTTTKTPAYSKAPPGSIPREASISPPSRQCSKAAVTSVQVQPTNDDDKHGDLTVEGGVPGDPSASIAFQSLLVTVNSKLDLLMTIRNDITQHFFKHVKFITRGKKLAYFDPNQYSNTYCAVVTKGCNLPPGTDCVQWWETLVRREVPRKVTQLRSDRIAAMKWAYYGKCLRLCV